MIAVPWRTPVRRLALGILCLGLSGPLSLSALGAPPGAASAPSADEDSLQVFDEVWRAVANHFFDREFSGLDWDGVRRRYRPLAREASPGRDVHDLINRMLGELRVSHTALMEGKVFRDHVGAEFENRRVPLVGLGIVRLEDGYFVASLLEGGAAQKAGILRGDRIVSIEGVPAEESERLQPAGSDPGLPGPPAYVISAEKGDEILMEVQRSADDEGTRVYEIAPEETNQLEAIRRSVRVVTAGDVNVGVIHLRHFMSDRVVHIFDRALEGKLADVDALVVDLRGRGGSPGVVRHILRRLRELEIPVAAVIDGKTRSAKEVCSYHIREERLATLVGERTQGAVLGGAFIDISDGSVLMLAVDDVERLSKGERLEGVGVAPHVWVEDRVRYAAGEDRLLKRALEVAVAKVFGIPSRSRRWY